MTCTNSRDVGRGGGGAEEANAPPQILAEQLTLSLPGGQIMPPHYYYSTTPEIFRTSDIPE